MHLTSKDTRFFVVFPGELPRAELLADATASRLCKALGLERISIFQRSRSVAG